MDRRIFIRDCAIAVASGLALNSLDIPDLSASADKSWKAPILGVIRWDGNFLGSEWAKYVSDSKWRNRWPFYAKEIEGGKRAEIIGDKQDVLENEIAVASKYGIDYWAFCYYNQFADHKKYNYGLERYLRSTQKSTPNFSVIFQGTHTGDKNYWPSFSNQLIELFKDPRYQTIEGRPLVFGYDIGEFVLNFGDVSEVNRALEQLKEKTVSSGLKEPFIVGQNLERHHRKIEFDALSFYTANGGGKFGEYPHESLVAANRGSWNEVKDWNKNIIPLGNLGWDGRPRLDHPKYGHYYRGPFYTPATFEQIRAQIVSEVEWMKENNQAEYPNTMLLYAWNEFGEGGIAIPTLERGEDVLKGIKAGMELAGRVV